MRLGAREVGGVARMILDSFDSFGLDLLHVQMIVLWNHGMDRLGLCVWISLVVAGSWGKGT